MNSIVKPHMLASQAGVAGYDQVEEALSFLLGSNSDVIPDSFETQCENAVTEDRSTEGPQLGSSA